MSAFGSGVRCCLLVSILCAPAFSLDGFTPAEVSASTVSSNSGQAQAMVLGFMGGFVRRDASHYDEFKLVQALREEYPQDVYIGLFENHCLREAYSAILQRLDTDHDGRLSAEEKSRANILLFGHSWGASAVVALARKLEREKIPVTLTVQVDSVAKPFQNDRVIPSNVRRAINLYQIRGWVHGQSHIVAANPEQTQILGNLRFDYDHPPAHFAEYPWLARFMTRKHIEIESDPQVWLLVHDLFRDRLPGNQAANVVQ